MTPLALFDGSRRRARSCLLRGPRRRTPRGLPDASNQARCPRPLDGQVRGTGQTKFIYSTRNQSRKKFGSHRMRSRGKTCSRHTRPHVALRSPSGLARSSLDMRRTILRSACCGKRSAPRPSRDCSYRQFARWHRAKDVDLPNVRHRRRLPRLRSNRPEPQRNKRIRKSHQLSCSLSSSTSFAYRSLRAPPARA